MFSFLIVTAIVLVLAILILLFRISTLVSVMKGEYKKPVGPSNKINAFLFMAFLVLGFGAFFWYTIEAKDDYLPEAVSIHGKQIDLMFWVTMGILTAAFLVVNFFLFYFAFKYQYKEGTRAYFYPENNKLEVVWTVIPAIVMAILVFYGWTVWAKITDEVPKNAEVIEVMGYQFAWKVRYPGLDGNLGSYDYKRINPWNEFGMDFSDPNALDDFSPPEMHIPKGQPVLLKIRARDVLHSVFLPHFRVKMDAVPGVPTKFHFIPTKTTREMRDELGDPDFNYELACTEICGRGHFSMKFIVVVDEPEEYEQWKREQQSIAEMNIDKIRKEGQVSKDVLDKAGLLEEEGEDASVSPDLADDEVETDDDSIYSSEPEGILTSDRDSIPTPEMENAGNEDDN